MYKKIALIGILLALLSFTTISLDITDYSHCYEEGKYTYCYELTTAQSIPVEFTEDVTCTSDEDMDCYSNCGNITESCSSTVEVKENTDMNVSLRRFNPNGGSKEIIEEKTIEKGTEAPVTFIVEEVNYSKCEEPKMDTTGFYGLNTYSRNCSYEGEKYTINASYYGNGMMIHDIWKPKDEIDISLPSLPVMILAGLVAIVAIWVLYPKITKRQKSKK